jgi:large subunit ribosomal protein L30
MSEAKTSSEGPAVPEASVASTQAPAEPASPPAKKMMRVQLVRSAAHRLATHKACVRGLGLRRMHHIVTVEDTPSTRGMVNKVSYMVRVLEET